MSPEATPWLIVAALVFIIFALARNQSHGYRIIALLVVGIGCAWTLINAERLDLREIGSRVFTGDTGKPRTDDRIANTGESGGKTDIGKSNFGGREPEGYEGFQPGTGSTEHPTIIGSDEFREAIEEALEGLQRASREVREGVGMIRSITERTEVRCDAQDICTAAIVRPDTCDANIYPSGWLSGQTQLVRTIAHEGRHCWLTARGREYESKNHTGFDEFERRVAAEVFGRTASRWSWF